MQAQIRKAQRFAVSGVLVTGLHVVVAAALIRFGSLPPAVANGVAFVFATAFSYTLNTLWSFSSTIRAQNLMRFLLVSTVGCVLAMAVSGMADLYGMHYWIGILGVVATVPPITFLLHSNWTYR
jgi:putative flippase GtrA